MQLASATTHQATQEHEVPSTTGPAIRVTNLTKTFTRKGRRNEPIIPVNDVSLDVVVDDLVVLLGPSGCGKTTLLRCVAGLEVPDSGEIEIDGRVVFSSKRKIFVPPERRGINMIFQSYALWPHMTVFDNVAFPLKNRGLNKRQISERVVDILGLVGLDELAKQHPGQISGGQQQRVALARALVGEDKVILFDEPLSNVDAKVREKLRIELLDIKRKLGFSALYVTHDQTEAMELADRIAVLSNGKVSQYDTPRTIYDLPATEYVGKFIGSANTMRGQIEDGAASVGLDEIAVTCQFGRAKGTARSAAVDRSSGSDVTLLSRPEAWTIGSSPATHGNSWQGDVENVLFSGPHTEYRVRVADTAVRILSSDPALATVGERVWASVPPHALLVLSPGV